MPATINLATYAAAQGTFDQPQGFLNLMLSFFGVTVDSDSVEESGSDNADYIGLSHLIILHAIFMAKVIRDEFSLDSLCDHVKSIKNDLTKEEITAMVEELKAKKMLHLEDDKLVIDLAVNDNTMPALWRIGMLSALLPEGRSVTPSPLLAPSLSGVQAPERQQQGSELAIASPEDLNRLMLNLNYISAFMNQSNPGPGINVGVQQHLPPWMPPIPQRSVFSPSYFRGRQSRPPSPPFLNPLPPAPLAFIPRNSGMMNSGPLGLAPSSLPPTGDSGALLDQAIESRPKKHKAPTKPKEAKEVVLNSTEILGALRQFLDSNRDLGARMQRVEAKLDEILGNQRQTSVMPRAYTPSRMSPMLMPPPQDSSFQSGVDAVETDLSCLEAALAAQLEGASSSKKSKIK